MKQIGDPLQQASNLSDLTWRAIRQHPIEYKIVHDFTVKKLSALLDGKRSQVAVNGALIKACSAGLESPRCRAAIKKISKSAAMSRGSASRSAKPIKYEFAIGIGGAAVLVLGAFVVGFIIGTAIAKATGISDGL